MRDRVGARPHPSAAPSSLSASEADQILKRTAQSVGLPCVDPIRTGVEPIIAALESFDVH